ncbi:M23 family metallopeptidase [Streptomyces sp. NPDC004609]|uniref:M23 family metallopeptidase n=1 Tax=Streptomyces sp. NPDC004609 TaxID=3364704 RepID=UPI0036C49E9F
MAFTRPAGKHRAPSRMSRKSASIAGAATLATTGVIGTIAAPAFAADSDSDAKPAEPGLSAEDTGVIEALGSERMADTVADQAVVQRKEADEAAARAQAAAEARAKAAREAEERAAREAERKLLNTYRLPVAGSHVSTAYQANSSLWSSGTHTGVDFRAPAGTSVVSVGAGTVVEAGWGGAYGYNVVIKMRDGSYTQYGHLSSISVSVGQEVMPGQRIGLAGSTGNSTGPHLHFEVRTDAEYGSDISPIAYLRSHGVKV